MLEELLGIELPLIQAPMAGVSSPALAAAVSNARALGSIAVGATDAPGARGMIAALRERSARPFNVNVFCHRPAKADKVLEANWIERLRPAFESFGASVPSGLGEIYKSFVIDDEMLAALIEARPKVVSFHFGLPSPDRVQALRDAGIVLLGCATSLAEAKANIAGGVDAVIAQGWEAGGHRGVFDPEADDARLDTLTLTRSIARETAVPVIAAGGIMDGAGIAAALRAGASAAQLGTAFVACPESLADDGYLAALFSEAAHQTVVVRTISGRPARCLANQFTAWSADIEAHHVPAYPIAYDMGKALNAAAKLAGETAYGAQWAGTGAPMARSLPAARLVERLAEEIRLARGS